jgi:hypothetical protein
MIATPPAGNPRPWGRLVALGAGCSVTLVGILRGLDPDVILLRAFGAALVLGLLATVVQGVMNRFLRPM